MKIREIKYPQMFKSYIDCISKTSRLAKLSTCKNDRNFQFAKLSPREIKVFYSTLDAPTILHILCIMLCHMPGVVMVVDAPSNTDA